MNLAIFGATGRVGSELTKQALEAGHKVTVMVRDASKVDIRHENLSVITGDLFDPKSVSETVSGKDAVICAIGDGRKGKIREAGTRSIIEAMKKAGVKRLICQSTLGAGDSNSTLNFFWKYIMFGLFLRAAFLDHEQQEELVRNSGLDWTIVRPAAFTNGDLTGSYKEGTFSSETKLTLKISLKDLAEFLLKQVNSDDYISSSPGLSY